MRRIFYILILIIGLCSLSTHEISYAEEAHSDTVTDETQVPEKPVRNDYRLLKVGSSGEDVINLQNRLKNLGYDPGTPDGEYGSATRSAVRSFQRMNGLDDDGIAGEKTQNILFSDNAVPFPDRPDPVDVLSEDVPYLINKEHPVSEFFEPENLVLLTDYCFDADIKIKYKNTMGVKEAVQALFRMLEQARKDGLKKWQISAGYRTWNDQESLLNKKINQYKANHTGWSSSKARNAALKTVAEPGKSEHHLGLAFDVNVPGTSSFKGTKQCKWLHEHCWEYGFIIRYPQGKESFTGYSAEEWHIRYVGTEHSIVIRDNDLCLEEYLDEISSGRLESVTLE